jgi:hypothetical protein
MAKLPMNVVKFAALTNDADSVLVYELFQDYFCHYMDETQKRNIGAYDTSRTLAEKDGKMHTQLLSEVQKLAGVEINEDNARRMAKNPMVTWATFAVVEAMIDAVLPLTLINSVGLYTEMRNINFGDSASFEIAPRSLMTVSQGANAQRTSFVQKQFKTTKTLVATNHVITTQVAMYKVLAGQESLAEFVKKAVVSIETEMTKDAYGAFRAGLTALTMPANLKVTGYNQLDLLQICERVTAYNGGAKAVIVGTASAISNILPNGADGWRINTDGNNMGIHLIKNFFDYDIMVLPQVATGDFATFDMALNDNEIYVISPTSEKLVKGVIEGSDLTNSNDYYDNANLTSNATINKRWAFEFLSNAVAGCVQFS